MFPQCPNCDNGKLIPYSTVVMAGVYTVAPFGEWICTHCKHEAKTFVYRKAEELNK